MSQQPRRRSFAKLVLGLAAGIGFLFLAVWGFQEARESARQQSRANCLRQIGLGILTFDDANNRLPDPVHFDKHGRPLCSWRFRVLPYLEAIMRDFDYEVPWDDPVNDWLTSQSSLVYCLPFAKLDPESLHTNVVLITGPGTAFDGEHVYSLRDMDKDQILAIEVADSGVPWAAPGDLSLEGISPEILQGLAGDGVHVLFADGEVAFVPADAAFEKLKRFFTVQGARENDREELVGTMFEMYRRPSSH